MERQEVMDLSFKLESFEGPLDLLLHLIEKNKVDIYDIPIAEIAQQYFLYIEEMQQQSMEVMSEFLVMAATLLEIKARMLLPPEKDEEGVEIDPRSELVEKLLEYKMYKYMSYELRDLQGDAEKVLYRSSSLPPEVKKWRRKVSPEDLLGDLTLRQMGAVFQEVLRRQEDRRDPIRSQFGQIEKEKVDSAKIMNHVSTRIRKQKKCSFRSLLEDGQGKMSIVVTFLTVLELMKMGRIDAAQDENFGEIMITARDESEWDAEYAGEEIDLTDVGE